MAGGGSPGSKRAVRACACMWCTPTSGLLSDAARVFAAFDETLRQPPIPMLQQQQKWNLSSPWKVNGHIRYAPGPLVKAMPSISDISRHASFSALRTATGWLRFSYLLEMERHPTHHILLMGVYCNIRMDTSIYLISSKSWSAKQFCFVCNERNLQIVLPNHHVRKNPLLRSNNCSTGVICGWFQCKDCECPLDTYWVSAQLMTRTSR